MEKPKLIKDLGMKYPTLTSSRKYRFGQFKCPLCENIFECRVDAVKNNKTISCGCVLYGKPRTENHNMSNTPIYREWSDMRRRCFNTHCKAYSYYGARGITVCEEWNNDFRVFYNWAISNGYSKELQLDRIKNDGNYEPNNCRFTIRPINLQNTRLLRKDNKTGYRCVAVYGKNKNYYRIRITAFGKIYTMFGFLTAEDAAQAYNDMVIKNGWNHPLNIIPENYALAV